MNQFRTLSIDPSLNKAGLISKTRSTINRKNKNKSNDNDYFDRRSIFDQFDMTNNSKLKENE